MDMQANWEVLAKIAAWLATDPQLISVIQSMSTSSTLKEYHTITQDLQVVSVQEAQIQDKHKLLLKAILSMATWATQVKTMEDTAE